MKEEAATRPFITRPGKDALRVARHNHQLSPPSLMALLLWLLCGCLSFTASAAEKIYYYHNDHLGSPVAMTDQQGAVVWRADYQPFGETTTTGSVPNTHGYIGKEKDPETGLYYVGARYYDPNVGRFLSIDPIRGASGNPQRLNLYAYSLNNPYRYYDPTGLYASQSTDWRHEEFGFDVDYSNSESTQEKWVQMTSEALGSLIDEHLGQPDDSYLIPGDMYARAGLGGNAWNNTRSGMDLMDAIGNTPGQVQKHMNQNQPLHRLDKLVGDYVSLVEPHERSIDIGESRKGFIIYDPLNKSIKDVIKADAVIYDPAITGVYPINIKGTRGTPVVLPVYGGPFSMPFPNGVPVYMRDGVCIPPP